MPLAVGRNFLPADQLPGGAVLGVDLGSGFHPGSGQRHHAQAQSLPGIYQRRKRGVVPGIAEILRGVIGLLVKEALLPGIRPHSRQLQGAPPRVGLLLCVADVAQGLAPAADGVGAARILKMARFDFFP